MTAACIWQYPGATGLTAQVGALTPFNTQCYGQLALLGTPVHEVRITVAPTMFTIGSIAQITVTGVVFQGGEEVVVRYLAHLTDGTSVTEVDGIRADGGGGIVAMLPVPVDLKGMHYTVTATGSLSGNVATTGLTVISASTSVPTITPAPTMRASPPPTTAPSTVSVPTPTSTPTEAPTVLPTNAPTPLPSVTPESREALSFSFERLRIVNAQGKS